MEEKRVTKVQNLITSSADIERQVMPIISKCIDGVTAAATIINSKEVIMCFHCGYTKTIFRYEGL
jgi:hypothetical protein